MHSESAHAGKSCMGSPSIISFADTMTRQGKPHCRERHAMFERCLRVCVCVAAIGISDSAQAEVLSLWQFGQLAAHCGPGVAPSTLGSIAMTESGLDPLVINDNTTGTSGAPQTLEHAVGIASALLEAGHSIDVGLMQINSANFSRLGLTTESAFDPCQSVAAAAKLLVQSYAGGSSHAEQQAALRRTISTYNTGDPERGLANGYVHKVRLAARQMVPALEPEGTETVAAANPSTTVPTSTVATASWDVWRSLDNP